MNNDRFKFRVWNKRFNEYVPDNAIDDFWLDHHGQLRYFCGEQWKAESLGVNYIIEQCTGLKDRHGVLIFEGDIGMLGQYKCILKWSNRNAKFWWIDKETNQEILGRPSDSEIIGNIHEEG
jgi:hypothetical protein